MPERIPNHFPTRGPVPPSDLVGRHDFVRSLVTRLELGENLIIAGPRRTGKSSVARAAAETLSQAGVTVIELDIMKAPTAMAFAGTVYDACVRHMAGPGAWWDKVASRVGGQASLKAKLGPFFELGLSLTQTRQEPQNLLDKSLSLPTRLAERKGKRTVVVMDEFQEASKIHPDFFRILRPYVVESGEVSYLFLGSRATLLRNLFIKQNEPLYRTAFDVEMVNPPEEEWRAYLSRKYEAVGIGCDGRALSALLERTGCHPQDIMMVAEHAYVRLIGENSDRLTVDVVAEAGDRTLTELSLAFQAEWESLSDLKGARIVLPRIASGEPIHRNLSHAESNAVTTALTRLRREGVISRGYRGRYSIRESLFAEWLRLLNLPTAKPGGF